MSKDSCNARFKCARASQVQRSEKKIDGEAEWLSSVYSHRARGVSRGRTPMVFENIEMRNPAGFLLEDARHGYIQYIRYFPITCNCSLIVSPIVYARLNYNSE